MCMHNYLDLIFEPRDENPSVSTVMYSSTLTKSNSIIIMGVVLVTKYFVGNFLKELYHQNRV